MNLDLLDPKLIVIVAAVIVIAALVVWLYVRNRRRNTAGLRQKFGPEYDRAVLAHGSERKAESKLEDREKRVEKLKIRDLDPTEHERFSKRWESVQSRFVDSPKGAVTEADDLVSSLMKTRGYPVSDFDQRAADISVDHPRVVENYRSAHGRSCSITIESRPMTMLPSLRHVIDQRLASQYSDKNRAYGNDLGTLCHELAAGLIVFGPRLQPIEGVVFDRNPHQLASRSYSRLVKKFLDHSLDGTL